MQTPSCLTIEGEPQPKERPRINRKTGAVYTPKNTRLYEQKVAALAIGVPARYTIGTVVKVTITLYTGKKRPPDTDNAAKSIVDGLVKGGLIEDDVQMGELHVIRVRSARPRAEVVVEEALEKVEGEG